MKLFAKECKYCKYFVGICSTVKVPLIVNLLDSGEKLGQISTFYLRLQQNNPTNVKNFLKDKIKVVCMKETQIQIQQREGSSNDSSDLFNQFEFDFKSLCWG